MKTGEQLKLEGIERVADNNKLWIEWAVAEIVRLARANPMITSDDLRKSMREKNACGCHKNAIGAAFRIASRRGHIIRVAFSAAQTPSAHGRVVGAWQASQAERSLFDAGGAR